jgi:hypothetical protein
LQSQNRSDLPFDPALLSSAERTKTAADAAATLASMAMGLAENRRPTADSSYWVMNAWEEQCGFCGSGSAAAGSVARYAIGLSVDQSHFPWATLRSTSQARSSSACF